MERLHARYPFFAAARDAVDAAAVDLGELVARPDEPAVDRAIDRVVSALTDHTIGDPHNEQMVELLSYPVARVIVSLVDDPVVTRTYAKAEAATAHERVLADLEGGDDLKFTSSDTDLTVERLLTEFDLDGAVTPTEDGYEVAVTRYLQLAGDLDDPDWRLPRRSLADGDVPVTRPELLELLRAAIEERVVAGLPFAVPDAIGEHLDHAVAAVEDVLSDPAIPTEFAEVDPAAFPPCVDALLDRARDGEELPDHSWFVLLSFCATVGMHAEEVVAIVDPDDETVAERIRYGVERVATEEGEIAYPPVSCATMQSYGDCVNKDETCETIAHPLSYYETRLAADD